MTGDIIIPQTIVPEVCAVVDRHGIFKVFVDMISNKPVFVSSVDYIPDGTIVPRTFTSLEEIQYSYPTSKINLIGERPRESTAVAKNAPTDDELKGYLRDGKVRQVKKKTAREKEMEYISAHEDLMKKPSHDELLGDAIDNSHNVMASALATEVIKSELLYLFKSKAIEMKDKRRKGVKEYLNGMAKVILFLHPSMKKALLDALKQDESDNLL